MNVKSASSRLVGIVVLGVAAVLLVATRFPSGSSPWGLASAVGSFAVVAMAAVTLWPKAPARLVPATLVLSLALVLAPTSPDAWLAGVPSWSVALVYVLGLHFFFQEHATAAPLVSGAGNRASWWRQAIRFAPAVLLAAGLVAAPFVLALVLPARIASTFELSTALAPLVPLVFVAPLLIVVGTIRRAFARRAQPTRAPPSGDAAAGPTAGTEADAS